MGQGFKNELRKVFAAHVRSHRLERGWSQEDLASEAGLHRTYIGSIERSERNVSIDNIDRIALALKVEPADLLRR